MVSRGEMEYLGGVEENYQSIAKSQRNVNGNKNILIS